MVNFFRKNTIIILLLCCFTIVMTSCTGQKQTIDINKDSLKIKIIDIGQGDAILIKHHKQNILIDTGDVDQQDNLVKKQALIEQAKSLAESTDYDATTPVMKNSPRSGLLSRLRIPRSARFTTTSSARRTANSICCVTTAHRSTRTASTRKRIFRH